MQRQDLVYKFKTLNIANKLIVINIGVFLLFFIASFLFNTSSDVLMQWFVLPEGPIEVLKQPWSILTYSFLHGGFMHILFNMIWLNFFSKFVLNLFSEKRFLTIYLLGALYGGLLFVTAYNVFPVFVSKAGYLLGASASVSALMVFAATYSPNISFRFFMVTIKLWQLAVGLFLLDLFRLGSGTNPGGMLSHIGGGVFGYLYAVQLAKGNDIGLWFEKIVAGVANLFKTRKSTPFRKVHKTPKNTTNKKATVVKDDRQIKIDGILDKIGKSGYDSLTKQEKDFLFKAGDK
ncbi:MAG TPA: rhomboid family intramembrane serine protease [Flavobacteriaceae bacterium]|nr:rhomboid family intramembrane serine protease [Ulvibacter sp.]HAH34237.1 rhomboid family intramembrane serine protease [Flavobacteriaceae bacterium]|tara:strand:- start:2947 stop:3816 length:870 start_codon:yes stop_codon:yes gene_type:complete